MSFYADLLRPDLQPLLRVAKFLLVVLMGLHALQLALMLIASWRHRSFQLTSLTGEYMRLTSRRRRRTQQPPVVTQIRQLWLTLFGRRGFFGVESPYYEWRYALAELGEVASLSLQAYNSSSHLDPNRWLVDLYVACAVLNCWSTPLVVRAMAKWYSPAARRLACVLLDVIFDSGTSMLFPLVIFLPYARAFHPERYSFDTNLLYNDAWYTNLINESRQIFPLSAFDLLVKLVPHTSIFMALKTIRSIIRIKPARRTPGSLTISGPTPESSAVAPEPSSVDTAEVRTKSASTPSTTLPTSHDVTRGRFIDRCFFVWGLALLACHVSSGTIGSVSDSQCKQPLKPWFVRKQACSLYMFNCHRRGTDSVHADDLAFLHRPSLAVLVFAHCPALRMSPSIQTFPKLLGLQVYNSTLVEWGTDAAVSAKTHPLLSYIFIVRTNMSEIPVGMRGADLPATLMDIEFSVTNLTSVPDDLDAVWSRVGSLYIEYSQLTSIPEALLRMPVYDLSLIGNRIDDISSLVRVDGDAFMVSLARNPVHTIPEALKRIRGSSVMLNLVDTHIAVVPDWFRVVVAETSMTVLLSGTPFCEGLLSEDAMQLYGADAAISCSLTTERLRGRYPLQVTTPLWAP